LKHPKVECIFIVKEEENRIVNGPFERVSEDEGYLILEETLTQIYFLMERGDLDENAALGVLLRTPIMHAFIVPDILNEAATNQEVTLF
jgi:hypothetical protein